MLNRYPVSVIVLFHEGISYLKVCLDNLILSLSNKDEILVIVNNIDERIHDVNLYPERVKYYHYYENLGHGKAANIGVQNAMHEYVIIADHDLIFKENWIDYLWQFYHSRGDIGAVCCKILNTLNNRILDFGIAFSEFNFSHPFMDLPSNHPLTEENTITQMICTGGFFIKKKDFEKISGFNEEFGTLYTDLDISLRLRKNGLLVGVCSKAVAYHFSGEYLSSYRRYKASFLKSDVKGVFMKINADILYPDLDVYYMASSNHYQKRFGHYKKYFFCNLMNVANPRYYEDILISLGVKRYDGIFRSTGERDAENTRLFETIGYDVMKVGVPIAYFVDRFLSLKNNSFWWNERRFMKNEIIIDRNANVISARELQKS